MIPLMSLGACVADAPSSSTDDQDLLGAPVDYGHKFDVGVCAGPLNADPAKGAIGACLTAGTRCSGTLIASDMVLTARHCVHEIDYSHATSFCTGVFTSTPLSTSPVHVTTSLSVLGSNPQWTLVDQILAPSTNQSCADDLVILRLHTPIPFSVALPALVDTRELTTHKPTQVAVVGRGAIDETFDTTTYEQTFVDDGGLKRRVLQHIPFVCVSNTAGTCVEPDIGAPFDVDPGYAVYGKSSASGDSGSGLLRQSWFSFGIPVVIGVESAGTADPVTGKPNFSYSTRIDRHAAFILGTLFHGGHADRIAASAALDERDVEPSTRK